METERPDEELQGLLEQERWILVEITRLKNEAVECLAKDLEQFPEREIKRRFLANIDFGTSLSQDNIHQIKQRISKAMPEVMSQVIGCLNQESRWAAAKDFPGPGKSLAENRELWECMRPIEEMVLDILKRYGFPEQVLQYKMPTWFIGHTYMPAIAEKYWQLVHDIEEVRKQTDELNKRILRNQLTKKWDSA